MNYQQFNRKYERVDYNMYDDRTIGNLNVIVSGNLREKYDCPILCCYAGNYALSELKNSVLSEHYYLMGVDLGDRISMYNIGILYYDQLKYDQAEQYLLMSAEHGNSESFIDLGVMYTKQLKYNYAERYLMMAVELNNSNAYIYLGILYAKQLRYYQAEQYYLKAIENENASALNNLGVLLFDQKKYDYAERYYLEAVDMGNCVAMYNIGIMYFKQKKYDLAKKYYIVALENGSLGAIQRLERMMSGLQLYRQLMCAKKTELIENHMKELEKNDTIRFFRNKIISLSKEDECPICYEVTKIIPRECAHFYCPDCYVRIDKCCFGCDAD